MTSTTSAAALIRLVSNFAQRQPIWGECIIYETLPDERLDLTLVSERVYGNRDEFLTILAAAGLDSVEQEMSERTLVLPTARQLATLKNLAGLKVNAFERTAEEAADPIGSR